MTRAIVDDTATVSRLRPAVHASRVASGIHVRGWASSFTIEGGPALWPLWQALAARLAQGCTPEQLEGMTPRPDVRQALRQVVAQLREHDMLMEVPPAWGPPERVARWLEAAAPDPASAWTAWTRMRDAEVTVTGRGPVAEAAVRALTAAGLQARLCAGGGSAVLLSSGDCAVAAGSDGEAGFVAPVVAVGSASEAGFVAPVAPADQARREAESIAARLGLSAGMPERHGIVPALVGSAAAHRFACARLGLPDPGAARNLSHLPRVLVARDSPPRSAYHPWLSGEADTPLRDTDRPDLSACLDRMDAACDAELGFLPAVEDDDLPQVPIGLAWCRVADVVVGGLGVTGDAARLAAALGAVEHLASQDVHATVVCGIDPIHARGALLRRLVHEASQYPPMPDSRWSTDPVAWRWWVALTRRFGIRAQMTVSELAPGVHHSRVWSDAGTLGWAVEATVGDAAAFAALAAVGAAQWSATGRPAPAVWTGPCGAFPVPPAVDPRLVPWHSEEWAWPRRAVDHEPALQQRLSSLVGSSQNTSSAPDVALVRALRAVGFVLVTGGNP